MQNDNNARPYLQCSTLLIALCFQIMAHASEPLSGIHHALKQAVASGDVLSAHGTVLRGGQVAEFGFGQLDPDDDAAPDGNSAFQIGSITKVFTNLLLAEMVARGKVGYDTTIAEILGNEIEFANPAIGRITLLQLATHTSGLPRIPLNLLAVDLTDPYAGYDEQQLLAALSQTRAGQPLGSHQAYSNFGAGLLGYLLGHVHGTDYQKALSALVLEPLDLSSTGMDPAGSAASPWTDGAVVSAWSFDVLAGLGALWSTPSDLTRLAQAQLGTRAHELKQDLTANLDAVSSFAPGLAVSRVWHIAETSKGPVYWHNGATNGNASFFGVRPATEEALIVLIAGELDPTSSGLAWFGFSPSAASQPETDEDIEGEYQLAPGVSIRIFSGNEGLLAQVSGQAPAALTAVKDDWYALDVADASLRFLREDNQAIALVLHQGGFEQRAERIR